MSQPGGARIIPADEIRQPAPSRTLRFEGRGHGAGVSFFLVANDPGQGPDLHRHPYTETWSVIEGQATIRIGEETIVAGPGDTAVVAPDTWHAFTNTGDGVLRIICIHASPDIVQEDADHPR